MAEAAGELRTGLLAAGFAELGTVRTYSWDPPGHPATDRPVGLIGRRAEDLLWDRLEHEFGFGPGTRNCPGFAAPAPCATWRLTSTLTDELDLVVRPALRALTGPGERLAWLDWQHTGYTFDPRRIGSPGAPDRPGEVYPNGDYFLYLHPDLAFGTFATPLGGDADRFRSPAAHRRRGRADRAARGSGAAARLTPGARKNVQDHPARPGVVSGVWERSSWSQSQRYERHPRPAGGRGPRSYGTRSGSASPSACPGSPSA
ncbi:DUF2716 domain-containing protein [Streptomyces virginiae]|uniref:DUF2716 domain-containing protein n=1 Tax=Streptomyces virginiae TaxID=1961 RepID=UPI0033A0B2DF